MPEHILNSKIQTFVQQIIINLNFDKISRMSSKNLNN